MPVIVRVAVRLLPPLEGVLCSAERLPQHKQTSYLLQQFIKINIYHIMHFKPIFLLCQYKAKKKLSKY